MTNIENYLRELKFIISMKKYLGKQDMNLNNMGGSLDEFNKHLDTLMESDLLNKAKFGLICQLNNKGTELSKHFWDSEAVNFIVGIVAVYLVSSRERNSDMTQDDFIEEMNNMLNDNLPNLVEKELIVLNGGVKNDFLISWCLN